MKVLVIGSGAREHALARAIRESPSVSELFAAPGNPGIARVADLVPISAAAVVELADFAERVSVDLTVVGPELPLTLGIVDEFQKRDLPIFGPSRVAAEVEASKVYSKELCRRHGIPTARSFVAASTDEARVALEQIGLPAVLKADGLAQGKGVIIVDSKAEAERALALFFAERVFGVAGERIVVEEFLKGEEASFLVLTDGKTALPLPTAKDYKRVFDGDRGPNTGGMGAHSPAGMVDAAAATRVLKEIIYPALAGLAEEGREFRGALYAGLMMTESGPRLLEFNARLGDPETEAILPRAGGDIVPALAACAHGSLAGIDLTWKSEACGAVVLSSAGYPGSYVSGMPIQGIDSAERIPSVQVFHSGTSLSDGTLVTSGGRVLVVSARGSNLAEAFERAYDAVDRISFEGKSFRRDIGASFRSH